MNAYIKAISKRSEVEGKEKTLPIAYMGGTMISHGEEFEADSEYGQCLNSEYLSATPRDIYLTIRQCLVARKKDSHGLRRHILSAPPPAGWSLLSGLSFR
jgi:hypothetical protein